MTTTAVHSSVVEVDADLPAPTVAKTMAVIEAVGSKAAGLTQAEVVQQMGCSANPVFRVLSTLVTLGYMNRQEEDRRYVLAVVPLKPFTEGTKATREALLNDVERTRQRGYAEDWEEGIEGIRCVAAPILDAYQRPAGALTVMSPTNRLPQKRFAEVGAWYIDAAVRARRELLS